MEFADAASEQNSNFAVYLQDIILFYWFCFCEIKLTCISLKIRDYRFSIYIKKRKISDTLRLVKWGNQKMLRQLYTSSNVRFKRTSSEVGRKWGGGVHLKASGNCIEWWLLCLLPFLYEYLTTYVIEWWHKKETQKNLVYL